MHLLSKLDKGICFLLCVVDISHKYAWIVTLIDKRVFQLRILSKTFWMNLDANQTKYGLIKAANFITNHWNHGHKIIM